MNDPKAVKKYSGLLAMDTSAKGYWSSRFEGRGSMSETPIQILTELESDAGEQVFFDLLAEMRMAPVESDDNLENNEERQRFSTDSVYIDQARCGINTGGRMTRKRTLHNLREKARLQQSNWWGRVHDELKFMYFSGARGVNENFVFPLTYTGRANNAFTTPDDNHRLYGGDATAYNNIDANDKMSLALIGRAVTRAEVQGGGATNIPVLQPCKIDGENHYVCVMHSWQEDDLRASTATGDWLDLQRAAAGADGRNSPMFKGGLGMYRKVLLHSHRNVIRFNNAGSGANVQAARALFLGAQGLVTAYGSPGTNMRFDWHEEQRDNGNQVVISSSSIFGCKKVRVNYGDGMTTQDFGVFSLDTACASR